MRFLNDQKYCGWCGSEVTYTSEWSSVCKACEYKNFINPNPCSSVLVVKSDSVMLVRRAIEPKKGELDIPGGYMEISDPSMEAAAFRELEEEVGIKKDDIDTLEYLGSAKGPIYEWQNTGIYNAVVYFVCKLKDVNQSIHPDKAENSEIVWITKDDLDTINFAWDIDKLMLEKYFQKGLCDGESR